MKNTKNKEVLKLGLLMLSIIISVILVMYIIVKPGNLPLKINTFIFATVCWFLTKNVLINRKIFALMQINLCALYLMPQTANQFMLISIISIILASFLIYRVLQMSTHKDTPKAIFSCILYTIFGVISVFLIGTTKLCPLSIIATTNFAILPYLSVTNFNQGNPIKKELQ